MLGFGGNGLINMSYRLDSTNYAQWITGHST